MTKKLLFCVVALSIVCQAQAQLTTPADGGSVKASVSERIGLTDVSISYGRPSVKGREGKIWGGIVHTGFKNLGFGNGKPSPWRAGANENTVIQFSTDVEIEGRTLAAGSYGFFVAYGPDACTLIFSSNTSSWGSYFYDDKEDMLRVTVKPVAIQESRERLSYEFVNETDSSAVVSLKWEKQAIPFRVSTRLQQLQLASFDRELRGERGFDTHSLLQVASYMSEHNVRLADALTYVNRAVRSMPTFDVYVLKANILEQLHQQPQADSSRAMALQAGSMQELHIYARGLLEEKKTAKAMEVFKTNYDRHPGTFTTSVGLARGYAATGKTKDAQKYANKALPMAPDSQNKKMVEDMITSLKQGKAI